MEENQLILTKEDKNSFLVTAKWGKFLAIIGFIFSGFMILGGLAMMGIGNTFDAYNEMPFSPGAFGIIYILLSLIYVFPSLYLLRFSTQIKDGIRGQDQKQCSSEYNNLRRLFLFLGVMTIIILSIYVLAILFMIIGGMMGGML